MSILLPLRAPPRRLWQRRQARRRRRRGHRKEAAAAAANIEHDPGASPAPRAVLCLSWLSRAPAALAASRSSMTHLRGRTLVVGGADGRPQEIFFATCPGKARTATAVVAATGAFAAAAAAAAAASAVAMAAAAAAAWLHVCVVPLTSVWTDRGGLSAVGHGRRGRSFAGHASSLDASQVRAGRAAVAAAVADGAPAAAAARALAAADRHHHWSTGPADQPPSSRLHPRHCHLRHHHRRHRPPPPPPPPPGAVPVALSRPSCRRLWLVRTAAPTARAMVCAVDDRTVLR